MNLLVPRLIAIALVTGIYVVISPGVAAAPVSLTVTYEYTGWTSTGVPGFNPTLSVHAGDAVTLTVLTLAFPFTFAANFAIYPKGTTPDQVIQGSPAALVRSGIVDADRISLTINFSIDIPGSYEYYNELTPAIGHGIFNALAPGDQAPTLGAIDAPQSAISEEEVHFSVLAADADGDALSAVWSFTWGGTENGSTPPGGGLLAVGHIFAREDLYDQATVLVDDGHGARASVTSSAVRVACCGWLDLNTTPAVPGTIFLDGLWRDDWALHGAKIGGGVHIVSFGDVPGYATPVPYELYVTTGYPHFLTLALGGYRPLGRINVSTVPSLPATISIDGVPRNDWEVLLDLPPGSHRVSFGPVAGYSPPSDVTVTVAAGTTTTVQGVYAQDPSGTGPDPASFGTLRVTSNPALPTTIGVNGVARSLWGINWLKLPPGAYSISFGGVPGYMAPPAATAVVEAGQTTEVRGDFSQLGILRVMTDPAQGVTIFVNGTPRDDWGMWTALMPGTYTIRFGSIGDTASPWTPPSVTVAVVAGRTTLVVGHQTTTDVSTS